MKLAKIITESVFKVDLKFIEEYLNGVYKIFNSFDNSKEKDNSPKIVNLLNKKAITLAKKTELFDEMVWVLTKEKSYETRDKKVGIVNTTGSNEGDVTIYVNDKIILPFTKGDKLWKLFVSIIKGYLSHELVHIYQFDKIYAKNKDNPKKYWKIVNKIAEVDPEQVVKYLSAPMEIMAFASQAYSEFKENGFSDDDIKRYIKEWRKYLNPKHSYVFFSYVGWMRDHKAFKKFLKNIYEYTVDNNI